MNQLLVEDGNARGSLTATGIGTVSHMTVTLQYCIWSSPTFWVSAPCARCPVPRLRPLTKARNTPWSMTRFLVLA